MNRPGEKKQIFSTRSPREAISTRSSELVISWHAILFRGEGGGGGRRAAKFYARSAGRQDLWQSVADRKRVKTRGIRGIARWCISWRRPPVLADNRKKEGRKERKEREGSGPEDKCLPTSAAVLSGESIESIQREKKRAREGKRERERERERIGSRHAGTTGPAKMQVHVHVVCAPARLVSSRAGRLEVPAADRDRGNRDRDWDLKCYMNVCTYVGAIGRPLAGPCNPCVHMCAYGIARSHPPFLVKEPRLSPVFYPTASFVI